MKQSHNSIIDWVKLVYRSFTGFLFILIMSAASAATYYVAPDGSDANAGNIALPFQTVKQAQSVVAAGDTVYIRGGSYIMQTSQIASYSGIWAYVTLLNKSGTAQKRIYYWAYPGEKPVFDYSTIKPDGYRINAFEVTGSYLHIKGIEVTGVQVTITDVNTQSICFSNNGGSYNIYEQLSMHDGQAIGFYLTRGSNNLILNCDAYRNNDYTSRAGGGVNGGNVDGFGNHPSAGGVNNIFRGCRAWFNSDDGYDCITANEATIFENCWSFYNGYAAGFISRGDGNGFKAGGYGSAAFTSLPANIPRNTIRFCLSVRNKSNGFYSNHHLEGSDWYNNTAYLNAANYNMLNRKAKNQTDYLTDVPGYNHNVRNNISLSPRSAGSDITNYDPANCIITNNTFLNSGITVSANDFLSADTALLVAPRQADGSLPEVDFLRLKPTSNLIDKGVDVGLAYNGAAPDLGCFETNYTTLPVSLLSFTASYNTPNVLLKWQVANEVQNKGWDIERLHINGNSAGAFEKVGFVEDKGNNANTSFYSFTDKNPAPGTYQYRLKQIDDNSNFKYSSIFLIKVGNASFFDVLVYPNPVAADAVITYTLPARAKVKLVLYNTSGQIIKTLVDQTMEKGTYQKSLMKSLLKSNGHYILKYTAGELSTTKIITKG